MLKDYSMMPSTFKRYDIKRNKTRIAACLIGLSLIGCEIITLQNFLPSRDVDAHSVPVSISLPPELVIDHGALIDTSNNVLGTSNNVLGTSNQITARVTTVTGYTSHVNQTDSTPCISADGSDICKRYAKGEKICASNDYKLGTKLIVEGLGTCTVADRMNRRYTGTNRIDWYFGYDIITAKNHGIKKMYVKESKKQES